MQKINENQKPFLIIILLAFLVFFAQTKDFKLLVDGLTYAALSKNIIKTGDWKTLHYSLEQYRDFYQHPPLVIWMQAIVYKFFGFSEAISRVLPSLFALLTVWFVFTYTQIKSGTSAAFFSGLALITSTRFVKWGTNFYLDVFLAFFCVAGLLLWLMALNPTTKKRGIFSFISGLCFAFALMSKGVIAFGPLAVVALSLLFFPKLNHLKLFIYFLIGLALPLGAWILFADGNLYIQNYLQISVLSRTGGHSLSIHPWKNIFKLWWPWWPIFFFSFFKFDKEKLLIGLAALSIPIGFTLSPIYLEHYLTPFYPFAVILVGMQISQWLPALSDSWMNRALMILGMATLYLATISPSVNPMKETPVHMWIYELEHLPSDVKTETQNIVFTEASADLWFGLANILGKTNWQATGNFALDRKPLSKTILITQANENPDPAWQKADCLSVRGFKFYTSPDLKACSQ